MIGNVAELNLFQMKISLKGAGNIVRFNWHFYAIALVVIFSLALGAMILPPPINGLFWIIVFVAAFSTIISLLTSWYIYDLSGLYSFNWIGSKVDFSAKQVINVHAGFDESSESLQTIFSNAELHNLDFYDEKTHTEVSIERARKAYPPREGTISVKTNKLPLGDNMSDYAFAVLAAHEIRDKEERIRFFHELSRCTKSSGNIFVVEHLRDWRNFLVYNAGSFHFLSRKTWSSTFQAAGLKLQQTVRINPFIVAFILKNHGNTL